jgi:anti-anti-sigma regulatory factor
VIRDVQGLAANATTVEALARAQLAARRHGGRLLLRNVSPELRELIVFAGLEGVLLLEAGREPEEREQTPGVEEGVEPDDLPV